jgi:DNA-directed RNA polymerase specialized sigma24 family protein
MALDGVSQQEIAHRLGVNRDTVRRDMLAVEEEWQREYARARERMKGIAYRKLQRQEEENWAAWERSKHNAIVETTSTEEAVDTADGGQTTTRPIKTKAEVQEKHQVGDPRFQQNLLAIWDKQARLFGLYEPARHEVRDTTELEDRQAKMEAIRQALMRLPPEHREALAALHHELSGGVARYARTDDDFPGSELAADGGAGVCTGVITVDARPAAADPGAVAEREV